MQQVKSLKSALYEIPPKSGIYITHIFKNSYLTKGAFKYYVIKEVGGWGQKMAIFDDLQYF